MRTGAPFNESSSIFSLHTLQSLTGPVQGRIYYTGKTLFSLQGTPVLIAGTLYSSQGIMYSLQGIPCENYYTGKSLYSLQGMGLQCSKIQFSSIMRSRLKSWKYSIFQTASKQHFGSSLIVDYWAACPHLRGYLCKYLFLKKSLLWIQRGFKHIVPWALSHSRKIPEVKG